MTQTLARSMRRTIARQFRDWCRPNPDFLLIFLGRPNCMRLSAKEAAHRFSQLVTRCRKSGERQAFSWFSPKENHSSRSLSGHSNCETALNRIVHAPIARYPPRLNRVVRALDAVSLVMVRRHLEKRGQLRARRLHLPKFIGAARLQHAFSPVPLPFHAKSRMRLRMDRAADLRVFPGFPAVRGNFYTPHRASARPRQPCQLVDSWAGELLPSRRKRDHRFRPPLERQRGHFFILRDMSIIVVRHVVAVHDLDPPQPFGVVNPFESRTHEAFFCTPHSLSKTESSTPVHSLELVSP